MSDKRFPLLFQPGQIGSLEIPNRVVLAPMATGFEDSDGTISMRQIDYLVARAKGGTGLIMTGAARVDRVVEFPPTWTVPWVDADICVAVRQLRFVGVAVFQDFCEDFLAALFSQHRRFPQ